MSNQAQRVSTDEFDRILNVLETKAFYQARFHKQVVNLYPNTGTEFPRLAPQLYLRDAIFKIPGEQVTQVCSIVARMLVDHTKECPTPSEVRDMFAAAALQNHDLTFDQLYERAKQFSALPPITQGIANRWIEQVIYTTLLKIGREQFASVSPDQWKKMVTDVIVQDSISLVAYRVVEHYTPPSALTIRNFHTLLRPSK